MELFWKAVAGTFLTVILGLEIARQEKDVGVLLTALVEGITRKKINPKYEGYIHGAGMIALFALMGLIMFKDIFVIVKG